MAGAEKSPGGNGGETCALPSRARNQVREPRRRRARAGGHRRARRIRAQKLVPPLEGAQAGGGADGMERNGARAEERYAGTEPQSFGGGMGNMTKHDTVQGSFHEPPRDRAGRTRGAAPAGEGGRPDMTGVFTHDKSESDCPVGLPVPAFLRRSAVQDCEWQGRAGHRGWPLPGFSHFRLGKP